MQFHSTIDQDYLSLVNPTSVGLLHAPDLGFRFKNTLRPPEQILCSRSFDSCKPCKTLVILLIDLTTISRDEYDYFGIWDAITGASINRIQLANATNDENCQIDALLQDSPRFLTNSGNIVSYIQKQLVWNITIHR